MKRAITLITFLGCLLISAQSQSAFSDSSIFSVKVDPDAEFIELNWPQQKDAKAYLIKRANEARGPYSLISKKLGTNHFVDSDIVINQTYYYVVVALNEEGQQFFSTPPTAAKAIVATNTHH